MSLYQHKNKVGSLSLKASYFCQNVLIFLLSHFKISSLVFSCFSCLINMAKNYFSVIITYCDIFKAKGHKEVEVISIE